MRKLSSIIIVSSAALIGLQSCSEKKAEKQPHRNVQYVSGADEVTYRKIGEEITDSVQSKLKANLVKAMQEGGPVSAVKFCNVHAMELTSMYSEKYSTEVKRVSDRNRNAKNAANEKELAVIEDFKQTIKEGKPVLPKVAIDEDGKKNYYAPIYVGGVCLTCHGDPNNMQPELVTVLDSLYPNDKARGYAVDELRGIWSVKFKNS
ncbi:MAG: DUF3365 domain-containing protein [Flavobacteriales bacterium]|nr:DUF3365 domain-containing protein [Flavobacteriales bacterium]